MNFLSLVHIEFKKIRRSKIVLILFIAAVILWIPSVINAHLNFTMDDVGISPENNYLIQGFLGMAWFMFPASMVIGTVLLNQTERGNKGILKMLSLPISTVKLCLAKFIILLSLAALQVLMLILMYYISAAVASFTQNYDFILSPVFVFKEAVIFFLSAIPMVAVFWLLSVCIQTPVFSIGTGLALIVPSILIINTKAWFAYPMSYPLFMVTYEYSKLADKMEISQLKLIPWIPVALSTTFVCLVVSCLCFGNAERK